MKRIYEKYLTMRAPGPSAECAVIFNVEQPYHTDPYSPANTVGSATANFLIPKLFKLGPVFYLDPKQANGWRSLATLRLDTQKARSKTALARLKTDDHQVFYSTLPDLPMEALNLMVRESGARLFTKPGVLSWSNPHFLCVHAPAEETGLTLTAKEKVNWIEPFERELHGAATDSITIDLKKGETKFFCLERKDEWREFVGSGFRE
jgi:hypothetical protein